VDPEGDAITYSLTDDAGGRFTINGSTGVVTVANGVLLDFETNTSHNITVQASSTGGTSTQGFTIAVSNVNEPPGTITDTNGGTNTIPENSANGTAVGVTAHAVDPEGDTITYSLTDDAGGRFTINGSTGVVTVADGTLLNFEAATSHNITVHASSTGGTSDQIFSIAVTNVNEGPGIIGDNDGTANLIAENATNGDTVGITAHAIDPEGDTVKLHFDRRCRWPIRHRLQHWCGHSGQRIIARFRGHHFSRHHGASKQLWRHELARLHRQSNGCEPRDHHRRCEREQVHWGQW
jgi:predicted enzyme related to lactoylglutathione lyase